MRLRGKVALLTGAAAAIKGELMGFGGAAAHLFVREGAKVVLTDIRDALGERAAASRARRERSFALLAKRSRRMRVRLSSSTEAHPSTSLRSAQDA